MGEQSENINLSRDDLNRIINPELPLAQTGALHKQSKGLFNRGEDGSALMSFVSPNSFDKDEVHHRIFLKTLEPLYRGLTPEEAVQLTQEIEQRSGRKIGNHIGNLMTIPFEVHKGAGVGVHSYARSQDLEYHNDNSAKGIIRDIVDASTVNSIDYRAHIGTQYIKKALPQLDNYLNDALANYYHQTDYDRPVYRDKYDASVVDALSSLSGPEADAQQFLKDKIMQLASSESVPDLYEYGQSGDATQDINKSKGININAQEGSHVTIQDSLVKANGNGNGNGNGHGKRYGRKH